MSAIKEPQFCIVMQTTKTSVKSAGTVIKETLHEGQAKLLAIRCNNAHKDSNFWAMHHDDCLNMPRDKFFQMPEGI